MILRKIIRFCATNVTQNKRMANRYDFRRFDIINIFVIIIVVFSK